MKCSFDLYLYSAFIHENDIKIVTSLFLRNSHDIVRHPIYYLLISNLLCFGKLVASYTHVQVNKNF